MGVRRCHARGTVGRRLREKAGAKFPGARSSVAKKTPSYPDLTGGLQGGGATIRSVIHHGDLADRPRHTKPGSRSAERHYATARARALTRLERMGIPRGHAQAWLTAWEVAAEDLPDFRAAPDF